MTPARPGAPVVRPFTAGRLVPPPAPVVPNLDPVLHRPNDGSGVWADFSNTGYSHAPGYNPAVGNCTHGYPGVNDYTGGMTANTLLRVDATPGTVFNSLHFRGTVLIGSITGDNFTFNGCVFDNAGQGTGSAAFMTQTYLPTAYTQNYCTFAVCDYKTPPGNPGNISSSYTAPGTPCASSWQSFNVNSSGSQTGAAVVQRYYCDIWGNAGMQDIQTGSSGHVVILDHCYIHDQADTDSSGGCGYHHDGIGPEPGFGTDFAWVNVTNCTIASLGNTSGISYQLCTCHDMTISGNYFCGWGETINLGGTTGPTANYNVTFKNNVYSAEIAPVFSPLYAQWSWNSSGTPPAGNTQNLWRNNKWQYRSGDQNASLAGFQGTYWWPSDNSSHATDYTG